MTTESNHEVIAAQAKQLVNQGLEFYEQHFMSNKIFKPL